MTPRSTNGAPIVSIRQSCPDSLVEKVGSYTHARVCSIANPPGPSVNQALQATLLFSTPIRRLQIRPPPHTMSQGPQTAEKQSLQRDHLRSTASNDIAGMRGVRSRSRPSISSQMRIDLSQIERLPPLVVAIECAGNNMDRLKSVFAMQSASRLTHLHWCHYLVLGSG